MSKLNDAMVEAVAKVLCCGSVCNASGTPGDQCTASKFFGEKAHQAITAALALQPEAEQGWQPIETAPKDGERVQLSNGQWVTEGHRHSWWDSEKRGMWKPTDALRFPINTFKPTHWRPLPASPPTEGGQKA